MKKASLILLVCASTLFIAALAWARYYPAQDWATLLTPEVFDYPMPASVISYGVQNGLATILILALFGLVVLHEPISHLFIAEHRTEPRQAFEAKNFWLTLVLIPFFSLPLLWVFHRFGVFQIYFTLDDMGYMGLQLVAMVVAHDTYFYWCHRLLHTKPFRKIHGVHHRAKSPTLLSSHVFHYVETFINYTFVVWFALGMGLCFGRIYYLPVMIFSVFTIVWNVYGHGKRNLLPEKFTKSAIGRHIVWPSYHLEHHQKGYGNFEFFFTFWDELCGTRN